MSSAHLDVAGSSDAGTKLEFAPAAAASHYAARVRVQQQSQVCADHLPSSPAHLVCLHACAPHYLPSIYCQQDPCTWRIVLKNTVDFEPVDVQAAAEQKLDALVLSFQHLDSLLDMAREGNPGGGAW